MKQPTINQLNGRLSADPTIQFLANLDKAYQKMQQNWRHRYFKFKRPGWNGPISLSVAGNFTFGAAMRAYEYIAGINHRDNNFRQVYYEIEGTVGKPLQFQIRLCRDMWGVKMSVESNFKPINGDSTISYFKVRSNDTFENLDIKKYFERNILRKFLFAPGLFRNIQIWMRGTKKEAIEKYKELRHKENTQKHFVDVSKAWKRLYKIRLNILIGDYSLETHLPLLFKNYKYQKKRKILYKNPSPWELSELYMNEYDDDENMETFVTEYFDSNYPKNSIFV